MEINAEIKKATDTIYQKFGFTLHAKEETALLLKKYWKIPTKQIENSVVLEKCWDWLRNNVTKFEASGNRTTLFNYKW